jgi:hypothetical protein
MDVMGVSTYFYDIWGSSSSDVFIVGESKIPFEGGCVAHYNGATWTFQITESNTFFNGIWGFSGSDVYAVGGGFDYDVYHYNGVTWSPMSSLPIGLRQVWGTSPTDIFASGAVGKIFHYDGSDWSMQFEDISLNLGGVWGFAWNDVYVSSDQGLVLHYNGITWSILETPCTRTFHSVWGPSPDFLFAVGEGETVLACHCPHALPSSSSIAISLVLIVLPFLIVFCFSNRPTT